MSFHVFPLYLTYGLLSLGSLTVLSSCHDNKQNRVVTDNVEIISPTIADVPVYREWVGLLTGIDNATIMPQISGYLKEQNYTNGSYVKKGDVLFTIDDGTFRDQLNQAKAQLEQAKSNLKLQEYNTSLYKPLAEQDVVSKQQYMDSLINEQAAKNSVAQMEASVAVAQKNLDYTIITSPINGIAGISSTNRGNLVSPSGQALAVVSEIHPIKIRFSVSQAEWIQQSGNTENAGIEPGLEMSVTLHNGVPYSEKAKVVYTDNTFDNDTGSIMVEAQLPNEKLILRPGMFVRVKACLATNKNALTIDPRCIYSTQGKYFVVALNNDNQPEMIPVNIGAIYEDKQVITPIKPNSVTTNSRLVIKGIQKALMAVKDKDIKLNPLPFKADSAE